MSLQAADALMGIFGFKRVKVKKCRICKTPFTPLRPLQTACSIDCAKAHAEKITAKKARQEARDQRKAIREQRDRLKTRQQWLREAQTAFNAWIRWRDRDLPCISCGRHHTGSYDAGHYRSIGAAPQLRFDERQVWKQCVPCNQHKSGNSIEYRKGLTYRIGLAGVEEIEADCTVKRWTIEDAKRIKAEYKQRLKDEKG